MTGTWNMRNIGSSIFRGISNISLCTTSTPCLLRLRIWLTKLKFGALSWSVTYFMTCKIWLIFVLLCIHWVDLYILRLSGTMGWMRVLVGFFWTCTGMSSTKPVIYDSSDGASSVPSSNVPTPRSVNWLSYSFGIIFTVFSTSNNQNYFSPFLGNGLKKSPLSARIKSFLLLVCLWLRVFRAMSMLIVDGEGKLVRSIYSVRCFAIAVQWFAVFLISRT